MKRLTIAVFAAATILATLGCSGMAGHITLTDSGSRVRVTTDGAVEHCRFRRIVNGYAYVAFGSADTTIDQAVNDLRNDAARGGATHVVLDPPNFTAANYAGQAYVSGQSYTCP